MMARKSKIEELSVVADPWNLKLKSAKLKDIGLFIIIMISFKKRGGRILNLKYSATYLVCAFWVELVSPRHLR